MVETAKAVVMTYIENPHSEVKSFAQSAVATLLMKNLANKLPSI